MMRFTQHKTWWRHLQYGACAHNPGFYRVGGWDEDEIAVRESILRNGYIGGDSIGAISDVSKWHNELAGLPTLAPDERGEPATKQERAEARWQREQAKKQREKERIADAEWAAEAARRRTAEYNALVDTWQQEREQRIEALKAELLKHPWHAPYLIELTSVPDTSPENAVIRVLCGETTVFLK